MTVNGGTKVVDSQFTMLSELLTRELLKLDTVEAEGEAKVQRKIEVRRVHGITYKPFGTSSLGFIQCHYQLGSF